MGQAKNYLASTAFNILDRRRKSHGGFDDGENARGKHEGDSNVFLI